jgi:hypothetical protein
MEKELIFLYGRFPSEPQSVIEYHGDRSFLLIKGKTSDGKLR